MKQERAEQYARPSYKWIEAGRSTDNLQGRKISFFSGGIGFSFYNYSAVKALKVRLSVTREDNACEYYVCDAYYCGEWGGGWQKWQTDTLPLFPFDSLHGPMTHMAFSYSIVKDNMAIPSGCQYRFATRDDFLRGSLHHDDFTDQMLIRENDQAPSCIDADRLQEAYERINRTRTSDSIIPLFTRGDVNRADHPEREIHRAIDRVIAGKLKEPGSRRCIHLAMFDFDNEHVANHLAYAKKSGVDVECVGDWKQVSSMNMTANVAVLRKAGIPVYGVVRNNPARPQWGIESMHTKFIIFGDEEVHCGSYNLHFHLWGGNWENGLVYRSRDTVELYRAVYGAIKCGYRVELDVDPAGRYNLYYSFGRYRTEDGRTVRPQDAIVNEIESARQSVLVCMFDLSHLPGKAGFLDSSDTDVIEALIRARDRGLRVEILLNGMTAHTGAQPPPWDKRFRRPLKPAIQQLKDAWVQIFYVYYHESIYSPLHHKFAVIDGLTVITGSYNWYEPSILSDEVLSIVRDERIAAAFLEEAGLMRGCFRTEME